MSHAGHHGQKSSRGCRCHDRAKWLDDRLAAAVRVDGAGKRTFDLTVGITHPVSVCEAAFFIVTDFTGGSRTSAMAAWRAGRDRRKDRYLSIAPTAYAPKGDEMVSAYV